MPIQYILKKQSSKCAGNHAWDGLKVGWRLISWKKITHYLKSSLRASWASPPYTSTSHPPCVTWKVFPGLFHFFCPSPTFMYYTESRLKNKNGGDMGTRLKKRHSTYYKLCKYNCLAKATLQTCWSTFSTYFRYRVTPVNVLKNSTLAIRAVTANLVCKDT